MMKPGATPKEIASTRESSSAPNAEPVRVSRATKQEYGALLQDRITRPLKMPTTGLDPKSERKAQGHTADLDKTSDWHFDVIAGAGAIRSTARDLATFLSAELSPSGELEEAMLLTQRKFELRPGGFMGLGWHHGLEIEDGANVLWHNGGTGGFHSFMAFDPKEKVGVVVLANTSVPAVDMLGSACLLPG